MRNLAFSVELRMTRKCWSQLKAIGAAYLSIPLTEAESGKGRRLTGPPHTTRHAGPHRAIHQQGAHDFPQSGTSHSACLEIS